jgi:SsrA-binding protein
MAKKSSPQTPGGMKIIATNPIARANFTIDEIVEAGVVLVGTEIKSLRHQSPNIRDTHVEIKGKEGSLEAWLLNAHIPPYTHGNIWNHEPDRPRKLLLHSHQIKKIFGAITQKGLTIVPTKMYFKHGRAKVEIALAKGKKKHDKRETLKKRTADREMEQAKKSSLRAHE